MKPVSRLVLAALLFAAWIGWLIFLAATSSRPIVLSRPQFLVSTVDVIGRLSAEQGRPVSVVEVIDVHWPPSQQDLKQKSITVTNLAYCGGWNGPGEYILPLVKVGDAYEVVRVPPSPGFVPGGTSPAFRIYSRTPETMQQLDSISKPAT